MGTQTRPIKEIAQVIAADWRKVNYAAKPYLEAMFNIVDIGDQYFNDSAMEVVLKFLCNATTWRGPVARAIKAELKGIVR